MKIDGRSLSHDVLESSRFAAIRLYKSGVQINIIAASFKVTTRAVYTKLKTDSGEYLDFTASSSTAPDRVPNLYFFQRLVYRIVSVSYTHLTLLTICSV